MINRFNKQFFIFVLSLFYSFALIATVIDGDHINQFFDAIEQFNIEEVKRLSTSKEILNQKLEYDFDGIHVKISWDKASFLHFEYEDDSEYVYKSCLDLALSCYPYAENESQKKEALKIIAYFLSEKVDPDRLDHDGDSFLLQILKYNEIEEAERLVLIKLLFEHKKNVKLTVKDAQGDDALTCAIKGDYVDIVRFLRVKGAQIPKAINLGLLLVNGKGAMHKALTEKISEEKGIVTASFETFDSHRNYIFGLIGSGVALLVVSKLYVLWKKRNQKKRKPVNLKKEEPAAELTQIVESWD